MTRASLTAAAAFDPNGIVAGGFDFKADKETLLTGTNYAAGTLLGKITASGKYTTSLQAAVDGSQTPVAVLLEAVDASGGDQEAVVLKAGGVVQDKIVFGTGHDAASTKDDLLARGIFVLAPSG